MKNRNDYPTWFFLIKNETTRIQLFEKWEADLSFRVNCDVFQKPVLIDDPYIKSLIKQACKDDFVASIDLLDKYDSLNNDLNWYDDDNFERNDPDTEELQSNIDDRPDYL